MSDLTEQARRVLELWAEWDSETGIENRYRIEREMLQLSRNAIPLFAKEYLDATDAIQGRVYPHPEKSPIVHVCEQYVIAEDAIPDEFDSEDYELGKAVGELVSDRDQLRAEVDRLQHDLGILKLAYDKTGDALIIEGQKCSMLKTDLQAARKALGIIKRSLDESVDRGINDNRMKHMLEILLTSEEYETVIAALNAE